MSRRPARAVAGATPHSGDNSLVARRLRMSAFGSCPFLSFQPPLCVLRTSRANGMIARNRAPHRRGWNRPTPTSSASRRRGEKSGCCGTCQPTELWYVDGATYLGTLVIRHRLTPRLHSEGGHVGYDVVPAHRRRGHATAMLAESFQHCRALGLTRLLLTCERDNVGSRRVIEANGGQLWQQREEDVCGYSITLPT